MSLRALREQRGLTQEVVALCLGVSRAHYSRLETGQRTLTVAALQAVAIKLNLSDAEIAALVRGAP